MGFEFRASFLAPLALLRILKTRPKHRTSNVRGTNAENFDVQRSMLDVRCPFRKIPAVWMSPHLQNKKAPAAAPEAW
jgi:hypothetical protein